MNKKEIKTRSLADAEGNKYIIEKDSRKIVSRVDKYGFIYKGGKRVGHIDNEEFIEGYHDI